METKDGEDAVVEGLISLWKINPSGSLLKDKEISFEYQMKFNPKDSKVKLTLSNDRNIASLTLQKPKGSLLLLAWSTKTLKPVTISETLANNLKELDSGNLVEARFVGANKFFMVVSQTKKSEENDRKHLDYRIFDVASGQQVFEFKNKSPCVECEEQNEDHVRCLGFLVQEEKCEDEEGDEDESGSGSGSESGSGSGSGYGSEYSGGEAEFDPSSAELNLVFFFAGDCIKPDDEKTVKTKTKKEDKWGWTMKSLSLKEILEEGDQTSFIMAQGKEKLDAYEDYEKDYFHIPKNWFIGKKHEKNWECQISITANASFKKFALLNTKNRLYLAFNNEEWDNEDFERMITPQNAEAKHARNQTTKDELFVVVKVAGEGTTATCFYDRKDKKSIKFAKDHIMAA